jgi:DNA-binding response OmpR family regulator
MSKKILLVEDDDETLALGKTILENVGYEVLATADSSLALTWWRDEKPALVLFNPHLPLRDGHTLHNVVRGDPSLRLPKLAYLVPQGEFAQFKKEFGIPSSLVLTKPFEFAELVNRVQLFIGPAYDD